MLMIKAYLAVFICNSLRTIKIARSQTGFIFRKKGYCVSCYSMPEKGELYVSS